MRIVAYRSMAVCGLVLGLGGCVAVPLAQMAASGIAPAKPACAPATACAGTESPGVFATVSKSFHQMTGGETTEAVAK